MPLPIKATISGSSSATVLELNKYQSPLEFYLKTMEDLHPGYCEENNHEYEPFTGNAATRFGHAFESANIAITEDKLNCKIIDQERVFKETYNGVPLSSHVDGITEIDGKKVLFEGKTTTERAFNEQWNIELNGIPKNYLCQLMHNMYLADLDEAIISVLVFPFVPAVMEKQGFKIVPYGNNDYRIGSDKVFDNIDIVNPYTWAESLSSMGYHHVFRIKRDDELIQEMLNRYELFWNNHILTKTPPPVQGYNDIKWLIASPCGEIEATPEMMSLWSEKCDIENEIDDMKKRIVDIKNNFAVLIQKEIESKNIKEGHEDRKLNIYSGRRKLGSITKAYPRTQVKKSAVEHIKMDNPGLYETMKKTTFLDLMSEDIPLTAKQEEKFQDLQKFLKSQKLTKLLSKDSIVKSLQKQKPEIYNFFLENSIIEETTPKSSLRLTKNNEE